MFLSLEHTRLVPVSGVCNSASFYLESFSPRSLHHLDSRQTRRWASLAQAAHSHYLPLILLAGMQLHLILA